MLNNVIRTIAVILLVIAVATGLVYIGKGLQDANVKRLGEESTQVHHRIGNAYIHVGDANHTPVTKLHNGEVFYVYNKYIKDRLCHVHVTNLMVDKEAKIAHHYSMFVNWFDAGTYEFNELFVVPEFLPPGHYTLTKKSTNFCGSEVFYTTHYSLDFELVGK